MAGSKYWISSIWNRFRLESSYQSIQSVFKEVSNFQDLTMTLSGCFRESFSEMLVASSDRECLLLVEYLSIINLVVWLRQCLGQIGRLEQLLLMQFFDLVKKLEMQFHTIGIRVAVSVSFLVLVDDERGGLMYEIHRFVRTGE